MLGIGLVARVTGRAHADVEHLIRAKGQRAVGVLTAIGQVVDDPFLWTQRPVRVYGGAIHVVGRGDIQLPVGDDQAVRPWPREDHLRFGVQGSVFIGILQQQHVALIST